MHLHICTITEKTFTRLRIKKRGGGAERIYGLLQITIVHNLLISHSLCLIDKHK